MESLILLPQATLPVKQASMVKAPQKTARAIANTYFILNNKMVYLRFYPFYTQKLFLSVIRASVVLPCYLYLDDVFLNCSTLELE